MEAGDKRRKRVVQPHIVLYRCRVCGADVLSRAKKPRCPDCRSRKLDKVEE